MKRIIRILVLVVAGAAWLGGSWIQTSDAATASGCAALQARPTESLEFNDSTEYFLYKGDTIGAAMSGFFAGDMVVDGVVVNGPANTTLSYVIPETGFYDVEFRVADDTSVTFDYFCTPTALTLGVCDGGTPPPRYRVINGTSGDDVIYVGSGSAVVYGFDGNDRLYGGSGHDYLCGGDGNDYVGGGSGNDYVDGGAGNDVVDCGSGFDECHGQAGNDTVDAGSGNDSAFGESGNDRLYGSTGTDSCDDPDPGTYKNSCEGPREQAPTRR